MSTRDRGGWPTHIRELMAPALERMGPRGVWTEARLRKVWQQVVGEQIAPHANVGRLRGKVLEVNVASDAWATELTYLSASIVEKLNVRLGAGTVEKMIVRRRLRGDGMRMGGGGK